MDILIASCFDGRVVPLNSYPVRYNAQCTIGRLLDRNIDKHLLPRIRIKSEGDIVYNDKYYLGLTRNYTKILIVHSGNESMSSLSSIEFPICARSIVCS